MACYFIFNLRHTAFYASLHPWFLRSWLGYQVLRKTMLLLDANCDVSESVTLCIIQDLFCDGKREGITKKELHCLPCNAETEFDCHFIVEWSYIIKTWVSARRLRFYFQNSQTWFSAHSFTSEPLLFKHGMPCLNNVCISWTGAVRVPEPQEIIRPSLHCRGGHEASTFFIYLQAFLWT